MSTTTQVLDAPRRGSIGLLSCVAFAVGTMVGAGVFVLSGLAVQRAGPAATVSFVLAGVLVLLSALSFAVVASLAPPGGSGYAYVRTALGARVGFLASWAFWLGGVIGVAFVLNAFGSYLHDFFVPALPATLVAVVAVALVAVLNMGPASLIGRAETALVAVKVGILALLVVYALAHLGRAHFTPFLPHGPGAVVTTSGMLFIAYLGFNVVTNMAGDVDRPQRTIPLAILISMALVALIYIGVVIALLAGGISSYDEASVGTAARNLIGGWGGILIPIGALISTLSAANANMLGSSEIMVRLAADRQVPTVAGRLWHGHPAVSVLAASATAVVLLSTGDIQAIVALGNVAAIIAMVLVNAAAARAQITPGAGGIRLPVGPALPVLGALAALAQLVFIGWRATLLGLALVAAGLGLHALRGWYHPGHHATISDHLRRNAGPAGRALRRRAAGRA
ncbi:APC family permease [Micromonospora sp. MS34]|uniref:APC family permease n=1 Tax=Micromonospora sp. MS34 TaxID=3385971 RepID=UPI0039A146CF